MSLMSFEPFRAFRDLDRLSSQLLTGTRVPMAVPMDVWRDGQAYHVALDLPGVAADGIDLEVERGTLTVTAHREPGFATGEKAGERTGEKAGEKAGERAGERTGEATGDGHSVLVAERPMGSFTRQLVLGDGLDTEHVEAEYADGVLHVTIPVARQAQPRRIQVGHGGGDSRVIEASASGSAGPA